MDRRAPTDCARPSLTDCRLAITVSELSALDDFPGCDRWTLLGFPPNAAGDFASSPAYRSPVDTPVQVCLHRCGRCACRLTCSARFLWCGASIDAAAVGGHDERVVGLDQSCAAGRCHARRGVALPGGDV